MKRVLLIAAVMILGGRLVWMYLIPGWGELQTDFPNYYTAARLVAEGKPLVDLYDPVWFEREGRRAGIESEPALFNYFTPFSSLLMLPIADLSPIRAKQAWIVLSVLALAAAVFVSSKMSGVHSGLVVLIALIAGDALGNNFAFGQFYVVLTLLLLLTLASMDDRPGLAGAALALSTLAKVFPAVFIVYLAWTRRWRTLFWTGAFLVLGFGVGVAILGWVPHRVYFEEVVGRILRGEIQDPYNVGWNSLHALMRRALVAEPGLNPEPAVDLPMLYFILRPAVPLAIVGLTFFRLATRFGDNRLIEYGALVSMIGLITPSQASYHHLLLFPAVVGAVAVIDDLKWRWVLVGIYALICSNYMGATSGLDSGWWLLAAFPRAYLMLAIWIVFLMLLVDQRPSLGSFCDVFRVPGRFLGPGAAALFLFTLVSASVDRVRWEADRSDGATMVHPENGGMLEVDPTVGRGGLIYSSLGRGGFDFLHASASRDGLVIEASGSIRGMLADGTPVDWPGAIEPGMGVDGIVAIADGAHTWQVVERHAGDADWRELFASRSIVHDVTLSPDGMKVAFSEFVDGRYRISEWFRDGRPIRTVLEGHGDFRHPAYSPDGRKLAFATNQNGNWDVEEYTFDSGQREPRTTSYANDFMPAYSPDGRELYFASDRRRGYRFTAIYKIDLLELD